MKKILAIALVLVFAWLAASYFDVICHNLDTNPVYASWNLFEIFF